MFALGLAPPREDPGAINTASHFPIPAVSASDSINFALCCNSLTFVQEGIGNTGSLSRNSPSGSLLNRSAPILHKSCTPNKKINIIQYRDRPVFFFGINCSTPFHQCPPPCVRHRNHEYTEVFLPVRVLLPLYYEMSGSSSICSWELIQSALYEKLNAFRPFACCADNFPKHFGDFIPFQSAYTHQSVLSAITYFPINFKSCNFLPNSSSAASFRKSSVR